MHWSAGREELKVTGVVPPGGTAMARNVIVNKVKSAVTPLGLVVPAE
jgi:hypothetical protein